MLETVTAPGGGGGGGMCVCVCGVEFGLVLAKAVCAHACKQSVLHFSFCISSPGGTHPLTAVPAPALYTLIAAFMLCLLGMLALQVLGIGCQVVGWTLERLSQMQLSGSAGRRQVGDSYSIGVVVPAMTLHAFEIGRGHLGLHLQCSAVPHECLPIPESMQQHE